MQINQVLVGAGYGDAITNEALLLRNLFRRIGPSEIFSHYIDPRLGGDILPLSTYDAVTRGHGHNMIVAHVSIGEPPVFRFLMRTRDRLIVRYHNISPPAQFREFDPVFAFRLELGFEEVAALCSRAALVLADSQFNAQGLRSLGVSDVAISPVLIDIEGLLATRPIPAEWHCDSKGRGDPALLFVGRVVPHKNHPGLIKAFHVLKTYHHPSARLTIVGSSDFVSFQAALERFVRELALPDVIFARSVGKGQLAWLYQNADVFVCLSEHEGFCVPLVEAMAFDLPIVTWGTSAIPETVGGAGIVLDSAEPLLVAEAVNTVVSNSEVRDGLIRRGRKRLQDFRPEQTAAVFLQHLLRVA